MKKLMCLMVALLVAPAMATITVEIVDNADLTADIVITADGADADADGSLLAGIAFDASVDGGASILSVDPAKEGESTDGDEGYGIFMGNIVIAETSPGVYEITDPGGPVAPATAPDSPPQLPGAECTLEFGCLYNVNTPEAAPLLVTTLCTVTVDQATTLTLALDDTRGNSALIGGGAPSSVVFVGGAITGGECYTGPDYAEWVTVGKPDSWCTDRQCHGEAETPDATEVIGKGTYWVGYNDIAVLLAGFKQAYPDPAPADPEQETSPKDVRGDQRRDHRGTSREDPRPVEESVSIQS